MVSIAKGNVPSAIFNASISGLIGIFATPMLMQPFLENSSGAAVDQGAIIQQFATESICLPHCVRFVAQSAVQEIYRTLWQAHR